MRLATLQDIFRKAELLLNEPNKETAFNDPRMRTVKNCSGGIPLITDCPSGSKFEMCNLFSCQFSTYNGFGLSSDTVAVAEEQGLLFEYLTDLRTKLSRKKGIKEDLCFFVHQII